MVRRANFDVDAAAPVGSRDSRVRRAFDDGLRSAVFVGSPYAAVFDDGPRSAVFVGSPYAAVFDDGPRSAFFVGSPYAAVFDDGGPFPAPRKLIGTQSAERTLTAKAAGFARVGARAPLKGEGRGFRPIARGGSRVDRSIATIAFAVANVPGEGEYAIRVASTRDVSGRHVDIDARGASLGRAGSGVLSRLRV
jgi:hypothetical protein